MFPYRLPTAIIITLAMVQPQLVIAQDIAKINNIAKNITVKITGHRNGSGVIFERQGNIYSVVTNQHVVPLDTNYEIRTHDGRKHGVISRQEIPDLDLAIVQFESNQSYEQATLGNSDDLIELQPVYVAGFPGEQTDIDIIDGTIRSIRQEILQNSQQKQGYALNYSNQIIPGSSGGAVLDDQGRLIAINGEAERDLKTGTYIGRGIPINLFLAAREQLTVAANEPPVSIVKKPDTPTPIPSNPPLGDNKNSNYLLAYTTPNGADYYDWVNILAVSGNYFITGSDDNTIKLWNLNTGELELTLSGHSRTVSSVAVSGDKIVSGSADNTIKMWQLQR